MGNLAIALTRLGAVAGIVLLLLSVFARGPEPGYFRTGPQVPMDGQVEVSPPALTTPSGSAWDRERRRALLVMKMGKFLRLGPNKASMELRSSWELPDGGRTWNLEKLKDPDDFGGDADPSTWPAVLLCPCADDPAVFVMIYATTFARGRSRVYLAGWEDENTLGALPILTDRELIEELRRLGVEISYHEMISVDCPVEGLLEIRIKRERDKVTYRWGHWHSSTDPEPRWAGGTVTLTHSEVVAGKGLGDLVGYLTERLDSHRGSRAYVTLQLGFRVRYVDLLRAVESARGDPAVQFMVVPPGFVAEHRMIKLPRTKDPATESLLEEDFPPPDYPRAVLHMVGGYSAYCEGGEVELVDSFALGNLLRNGAYEGLLIRADKDVPYGAFKWVIRVARDLGLKIDLAFMEEDVGIPEERSIRLPPIDPAMEPDTVQQPDDMNVYVIYREILDLLRKGSTNIQFP